LILSIPQIKKTHPSLTTPNSKSNIENNTPIHVRRGEIDDIDAEADDIDAEADDIDAEADDIDAETDDIDAETDDIDAEADDIDAEADDIDAEADDIDAEADDIDAEADDIDAEADDIDAEADDIDAEAELGTEIKNENTFTDTKIEKTNNKTSYTDTHQPSSTQESSLDSFDLDIENVVTFIPPDQEEPHLSQQKDTSLYPISIHDTNDTQTPSKYDERKDIESKKKNKTGKKNTPQHNHLTDTSETSHWSIEL